MARKYFILFLVITLCLFSLMSAFLGERGFFANKELERQLKANEYRLDRDEVELENLRIQEEELSTEDGIRFAAMNLGYKVEGDDVYRFDSNDDTNSSSTAVQDIQEVKGPVVTVVSFKPWSKLTCFGLSIGLSFVITLLAWIFGRRKGKNNNDYQQSKPGDLGNDFDID